MSRGFAFFALAEVKPARPAELNEVQERVKADVLEEKALGRGARDLRRAGARARRAGRPGEGRRRRSSSCARRRPTAVGRGQPIGDLGEGAPVEEAAFTLPEKTLSGPVRTAAGFAILRVLERKAMDPAAFAQQKASVEESLRQQRQGPALPGLHEPGARPLRDRAQSRGAARASAGVQG